jgi:hypothetical protein
MADQWGKAWTTSRGILVVVGLARNQMKVIAGRLVRVRPEFA